MSGASWYYNWAATPPGITAPAGVGFVPVIWGSGSVTTANLNQVRQEGHVLLGFNEPDNGGQANMTLAQALDLWPKLMATGMTLGSPAVAAGGDRPGGWLDQFMQGSEGQGLPRRLHHVALVRRRLQHHLGRQRAAGLPLPTSSGSGTTGLFSPGAVATTVGRAFEAAGKAAR